MIVLINGKKFLKKVLDGITLLQAKGDRILATLTDLTAKLEEINSTITAEHAEVQALLESLVAQIVVLQDQLAAGQLVTQPQLDELFTSAEAIVARVAAISEPVA